VIVDQWTIGVVPYVFADGAYTHFRCGEQRHFAVEYHSPDGLNISQQGQRTARHVGDSTYIVNAQVLYLDRDVGVIDLGIGAYKGWCEEGETELPDVSPGQFVSGELRLFIDDFPYKEFLYSRAGIPPLIYTWRIDAITIKWAPYILGTDTDDGCVPDDSRSKQRSVESTDETWPDEFHYTRVPTASCECKRSRGVSGWSGG
jgi:hypothetical protein